MSVPHRESVGRHGGRSKRATEDRAVEPDAVMRIGVVPRKW
ncbi:hypothetical protein [Halorubrum vacuolatum]|nr:hypothetical protein [Halorubrum vacuolatum]